jgi:hypothetical protein
LFLEMPSFSYIIPRKRPRTTPVVATFAVICCCIIIISTTVISFRTMSKRLVAVWEPLASDTFARSSHTVNVVGRKAILVGGETQPRVPLPDAAVLALSLDSADGSASHPNDAAQKSSPKPAARVGAATATVGKDVYLFGGRGGKDMTPLEGPDKGPWKLDTVKNEWELLENKGDEPVGRSYHTLATDGNVNALYNHDLGLTLND